MPKKPRHLVCRQQGQVCEGQTRPLERRALARRTGVAETR